MKYVKPEEYQKELDNEMFASINEILDNVNFSVESLCRAIGQISFAMVAAKRRDKIFKKEKSQ